MLIYYNDKIVDEIYAEDIEDKINANFDDDYFDDEGNLHIDLPEDFELLQNFKQLSGYNLLREGTDELS